MIIINIFIFTNIIPNFTSSTSFRIQYVSTITRTRALMIIAAAEAAPETAPSASFYLHFIFIFKFNHDPEKYTAPISAWTSTSNLNMDLHQQPTTSIWTSSSNQQPRHGPPPATNNLDMDLHQQPHQQPQQQPQQQPLHQLQQLQHPQLLPTTSTTSITYTRSGERKRWYRLMCHSFVKGVKCQ